MSGNYGTQYVESEIILALQAGDIAEAIDLIKEMLPSERAELLHACERAVALLQEEM